MPHLLLTSPLARLLVPGLVAACATVAPVHATSPASAAKAPAAERQAVPRKPPARPAAQPRPPAAAPAAAATAPDRPASDTQLELARAVLTGTAACEFNQQVQVRTIDAHPGWFEVSHGRQRFAMLAVPTDTGAVRLEDERSGMVWLQIPAKSMLMDAQRGRRIVDACQTEQQRLHAAAGPTALLGLLGVREITPLPAEGAASAPAPIGMPDAAGGTGAAPAPSAAPAPATPEPRGTVPL
jgi:hypothetical protein